VSILHSLELTGPIGSILAQTQYYMLDRATARLFSLATNLTEPFVVSVPPAALVAWYDRYWPKAAIIGIRLARQLSGDKLPSAAIVHDGRR
jgi:hypothetical protein